MNNQSLLEPALPSCELVEDEPVRVLRFLRDAIKGGSRGALVTLVEIAGSAARPLGAHMAVTQEGAYCGFVSGGCVEAIVAQEAMLAIRANQDRLLRLGKGSAYFDVVLPCGGSIELAIHVVNECDVIDRVLSANERRQAISLGYDRLEHQLSVIELPAQGAICPGWRNGTFLTLYRPPLRLLLSGGGLEADMLARVGGVLDIETIAAVQLDNVDYHSAIVLLHHDVDREADNLRQAMLSDAFYIGCLGSRKTHEKRCQRLREQGFSTQQINAIHAPIGLFGPVRDARALAISILSEILSCRAKLSIA